jgi:thioester reductase-like protein
MPATYLFTGFPGFIGARLLPRLMELQPESRFTCLVQERFLGLAGQALEAMARDHPHTAGRISTAVGDITEPRLGLSAEAAEALRGELLGAYHLAAVYDLAVARELAERVNVTGTRQVLEFLAGCPGLRRLHYVSTAYVSGRATGVFRETDLDLGQSFKNHYEATKFKAEVDVVKSGLPATIYRPAIVVGDSRTGETAKFDGPYFTLAAMERVPSPGLFLRVGSGRQPANLVPVDFVIEAMARLASVEASKGRTYHLTDPEPIAVFEIERLFARALGKSFAYVPVPPSLARALFAPRAVQRFFGMPVQTLDYFDHPCRYDASQATADLATLGVRCPRFPDYVDKLVAFYRARRDEVRRSAMV